MAHNPNQHRQSFPANLELTTDVLPPFADVEALPHPKRIGRYRIEKILSDGRFGTVYLAHDDHRRAAVAVKVPSSRLEPEAVEALLNEARTVARLDHPHIVAVYDVGGDNGYPCYVVTRYVDGGTTTNRSRRHRQLGTSRPRWLRLSLTCCTTEGAGVITAPLLMFYGATRDPSAISLSDARAAIEKKLKSKRWGLKWQCPLGRLLLGMPDAEEAIAEELKRKPHWRDWLEWDILFQRGVAALRDGDRTAFGAAMRECCEADDKQQHPMLYIARYEAEQCFADGAIDLR